MILSKNLNVSTLGAVNSVSLVGDMPSIVSP